MHTSYNYYCQQNKCLFINAESTNHNCKEVMVKKLADTAAWLFSNRQISEKELNDFLQLVLLKEDWEDGIAQKISCCYLKEITLTANSLARKFCD